VPSGAPVLATGSSPRASHRPRRDHSRPSLRPLQSGAIARDGSGIDSAATIAYFVCSSKQAKHRDHVDEATHQAWLRRGLAD